jgi:hypothetical protein
MKKRTLPPRAREIRSLLAWAGWTQTRAATEVGLNPRTMRKYVNGESAVPVAVMMALHYATKKARA